MEIKTEIKTYIDKEVKRNILLEEIMEINSNALKEYIVLNYSQSINEMAKINTKEFYGYFHCNKFDIRIWSNGHNPPHFHVLGDGWDIVVSIDSGDIIKTKKQGKNSKFYTYVRNFVKCWMEEPCAIKKQLTNRENAEMQWMQNNSDLI